MNNLKYELKNGKALDLIPIFCILRIILGIILFSIRYGRLYFSFVSLGTSVSGESLSLSIAWLLVLIVMIYGVSARSEGAVAASVATVAFLCFYGALKSMLVTLYDKSELATSAFAVISSAVMALPAIMMLLFMTGKIQRTDLVKYSSFVTLAAVSVYAIVFVIFAAARTTVVNLSLPLSQVSLSVVLALLSLQISHIEHYKKHGENNGK